VWLAVQLCFVLMVLWASAGFANTAIIAAYSPTLVVIGADSLESTDTTSRWIQCKIGETNKVAWASSGIKTRKVAPIQFDADQVASQAVKSSHDFGDIITNFIVRASDALTPLLKWMATSMPDAFAKHALAQCPLQIIFAGIDHDKIRMSAVQFHLESNSNAHAIIFAISRYDCPSPKCLTRPVLGTYEAINAEFARDPNIWEQLGFISTIKKLLTVEKAARPDIVGGPLSIVQITPDGITWPERGACQDKQP
jgi:hypothetical protein